jgi:hypothetical protein
MNNIVSIEWRKMMFDGLIICEIFAGGYFVNALFLLME